MRVRGVALEVSGSTPKQLIVQRRRPEEPGYQRRCSEISAAGSQQPVESYLASLGRLGKKGLLKTHAVVLLFRAKLRMVALLLMSRRDKVGRGDGTTTSDQPVTKASACSPLEAFQMSESLLLGEMLLLRLLSTSASFAGWSRRGWKASAALGNPFDMSRRCRRQKVPYSSTN